MFRKPVRLHLKDDGPSIEGFLVGRFGEFYKLVKPKVLEAEDRTYSLDREVWVPKRNVLFIQRVSG